MKTAPEWIVRLFQTVDRQDVPAFVAHLTADCVFRYGSQDGVRGHEAVSAYVGGFYSSLKALQHSLESVWEVPGAYIVEGRVTYTLPNDKQVSLPFANIFKMRGEKIAEYLIFADPSPMAAAAA